jgi:hypothetical protein
LYAVAGGHTVELDLPRRRDERLRPRTAILLILVAGSGLAERSGGEFETPTLRLKEDGVYRFTVRIAPRYAALLEVPARDARVSRQVKVKTVTRPPWFVLRAASRRSRTQVERTSAPRPRRHEL